jgi:hypothetical protein
LHLSGLFWFLISQQSRMHRLNFKPSQRTKRILLRISFGLIVLYISIGGYIWWAMKQPPEVFGRVMMRMPGPVPFLLFPFETLWLRARAGHLHAGDQVPDFSLLKLDKSSRVQLSTLNQNQPVVLVFGSYT